MSLDESSNCRIIWLFCGLFSYVSSNRLPRRMQSYTGCISLNFPWCVSLNVPLNVSIEMMHNYTDCICLAFHHCVVPNVFSNCLALTLSGAAPLTCSNGRGGHIVPPLGFWGCWGVMVSNFCCNLRSYSDWHQTKGFTTFRYLEPPQLMVWKIYFFRGFWRFVRVLPYEILPNWTNFFNSRENGEFFWSKFFCNLFHTKS